MSPKTLSAIAVAAIAAGGVTLVTGGSPSNAQQGPATLTLSERYAQGRYVDTGKRGGSPGDQLLFVGNTLTDASGKRAGRSTIACTVVKVRPETGLCTEHVELADGTLTWQAINKGAPQKIAAAITGGTGRYAGARGTATIDDAGERATVKVELLP